MRTMQWIGIVTLLLCAPAMSQAPATAPAEPAATPAPVVGNAVPDLVADLDPYDPAAERTRFLQAAGIDNELDANEFDADRGKPTSFVRKFDRWDELLKCDKDKNGRIDWFEADAYRQGIRKALLAAFDADKDTRLKLAERDAANKALASDEFLRRVFPREGQPGQGPAIAVGEGGDRTRGRWGQRGERPREDGAAGPAAGGASPAATGDGGQAAPGARRRGPDISQWDKDGDGKLNDEERKAMWNGMRQEGEKAAWGYLKKWDADGDGNLSDEERKTMQEDLRKQGEEVRKRWEEQLKETTKKFDADGDGKLSDEERKKMYEEIGRQVREALQQRAGRGAAAQPADKP